MYRGCGVRIAPFVSAQGASDTGCNFSGALDIIVLVESIPERRRGGDSNAGEVSVNPERWNAVQSSPACVL